MGRHPNIRLLAFSEVESVSGYVGNFQVRIRRKPRFVDEDKCTGCGSCIEKCPWKKIPSEFDLGLGLRAAIYTPFPQAVPRLPVIDPLHCVYLKDGKCGACQKVCPRQAIDFNQAERREELEVGAIILATGFQEFDARRAPEYGLGRLPDVRTSLELERLINSGGPTAGRVLRQDGRPVKRIAVLHCVGSRGREHEYCSRVCCMAALKLAHLLREHLQAEVIEFYRDLRAFGKGYEDFRAQVEAHGVNFVRFDGDLRVEAREGELAVLAREVYSGELREARVDLVVLSTGLEPQADQAAVGVLFGVSRSPDGFFLEKHPKLAPVETTTDGVFLAGACQGPKDIPDSVAQGGAAAAAALALMDHGSVELEPFTAEIAPERCGGCQTCVGLCPYHAISMVEWSSHQVARVNEVLCKGCGACAAACPGGAAFQNGFTDSQILAEIDGILALPQPQEAA